MAHKKKRPVAWGRKVFFYISFPFVVWALAFLLWFYWYDLRKLLRTDDVSKDGARPSPQSDKLESEGRPSPKNRTQEKILEDDRKKLDDIIKRRG